MFKLISALVTLADRTIVDLLNHTRTSGPKTPRDDHQNHHQSVHLVGYSYSVSVMTGLIKRRHYRQTDALRRRVLFANILALGNSPAAPPPDFGQCIAHTCRTGGECSVHHYDVRIKWSSFVVALDCCGDAARCSCCLPTYDAPHRMNSIHQYKTTLLYAYWWRDMLSIWKRLEREKYCDQIFFCKLCEFKIFWWICLFCKFIPQRNRRLIPSHRSPF